MINGGPIDKAIDIDVLPQDIKYPEKNTKKRRKKKELVNRYTYHINIKPFSHKRTENCLRNTQM